MVFYTPQVQCMSSRQCKDRFVKMKNIYKVSNRFGAFFKFIQRFSKFYKIQY